MWGFFKFIGKFVLYSMLTIQAILGVVVLIAVVGVIVAASQAGGDKEIEIPEGAALVLNPNGVIVEAAPVVDPFEKALEEAYGFNSPSLISIHDVVRTLREAAEDDRISGLVLDLENVAISGPSKVDTLAAEIAAFKATGKPVVAVSDQYGQNQYYLATFADEIVAHPMGGVFPTGFGAYRNYMREFYEDRLRFTNNVFKVGTYKSAIEPLIRDDMSDEDKEARLGYLVPLWERLATGVDSNRNFAPGKFDDIVQRVDEYVVAANGDFAKGALDLDLFDALMTREDQRRFLIEKFGENEEGTSYTGVGWSTYFDSLEAPKKSDDHGDIAIVSVTGSIIDGSANFGEAAGGDTIAKQLRDARENEDVKAVVLRVDSGGGSAYASEIIRQQVLELQKAGKPVVASMGSVAASGGYWVLANADKIYAQETTITGSIGIFGVIQTFERTAEWAGITADGVGTAPITEINKAPFGPLPDVAATIFQSGIEAGYREFLTVVAEGRDMDPDYVDSIAQGRVWIGTKAKELGLIDEYGELEDAIAEAARMAEIEEWDVVDFVDRKSDFEKFLESIGASAASKVLGDRAVDGARPSLLARLVHEVRTESERQSFYNDPNNMYALCMECGELR